METTLIVAGIAFIGAAIAGGGLVAFKIEVPLIDSVVRQFLLAAFGAVLLFAGVVPGLGSDQTSQAVAATTSTNPTTTTSISQEATTVPSDSTLVTGDEMWFTTYFWDDGWIEHASWVSPPSLSNLRPVIATWNWSPDFPAFSVRYDDLTISGAATNGFDDGFIPPSWQPNLTEGTTAEESDGFLVVNVPAGRSPEGAESRVDLNPPVYFQDEFDISISFSLDDDFYRKAFGGFGLFVGEGDAIIWIVDGRYSSEQCVGEPSCFVHATTEASQLDGRLRITRSYVDG